MKPLTLAFLFSTGLAFGQAAKPDPAKPTAAAISTDDRARFWRLSAEKAYTQTQADKAAGTLQAFINGMATVCQKDGKRLDFDTQGEPACIAVPKPEAKPEKKP